MNQESPDKKTSVEKLKVTSAEEIRNRSKSKEKLVKLPSGIVVKLKIPSIANLLVNGKIPNDLMDVFLKPTVISRSKKPIKINPEDYKENLRLIEIFAKESFVEPKLVENNPQQGEICLSDLDDEDKLFIFNYVTAEVGQLKSFR